MATTRTPSGRAGPADGLPSGERRAATWRTTSDPAGCFYRNRQHCSGGQVTVHTMTDYPDGGPTFDVSQVTACVAHAIARHGVFPGGEPTAAYRAAVSE